MPNEFLLSLVNDILDISKIDSGVIELHPESYPYADFYSSIVNMFLPLCESKGIQFAVEDKHTVPAIDIDRVRFNQIAMNLISNAIKYTPSGGTVTVISCADKRSDGLCDCVLAVSDTGIGMSREFQKIMFEPFTQEDNNPKRDKSIQGSGLGLSLVKKLVDLIGGSISVKSELGIGTEVSVFFTAKEVITSSDFRSAADSHMAAEKEKLSGKVLIAEDNDINTEIAKRILESMGLEVIHAENGACAVDLFSSSKPDEYRAIFMDIQMPVMNGYEATKVLRGMNRLDAKTVPIIAMTADAFSAAIEHSKSVGMTDYVTKPLDANLLRTILEKLWDRHR